MCPKCGETEPRIRFHIGTFSSYRTELKQCSSGDFGQDKQEHMHYYCDTCRYDWTGGITGGAQAIQEI